jgi:ABC-type transport system substrate-binding protein
VTVLERMYRDPHASRLRSNPQTATDFFFLNTRVPPFDDLRVRRAVNFAIDPDRIVKAYGGPRGARPICQLLLSRCRPSGVTARTRATRGLMAAGGGAISAALRLVIAFRHVPYESPAQAGFFFARRRGRRRRNASCGRARRRA